MDNDTGNLQRYIDQMVLIKKRQEVIWNILSRKTTTGFFYSDIEICVLEIRKIIELIAMGSLVSNMEKYSTIHEKYQNAWNAKYIFNDIERINPDFYPKPIDIKKTGKYDEFVPVEKNYLHKKDAIKVYDKCSAFLHEDNPFKTSHDVSYYVKNIPLWDSKIINLLNRHTVRIYDDCMYFISMRSEKDGNPHGAIFKAISKNEQ